MSRLSGVTVLIVGATSAMGAHACAALLDANASVIAVGRDADALSALAAFGARTECCDLTDESQVAALAHRLRHAGTRIDGVFHLVGGWRGGGGLAAQSEQDFRFLEGSLTSLRHVSRAFEADIARSPAGRFAIISSTAVTRPRAGAANYVAVKAASEAWVQALADSFRTQGADPHADAPGQHSAAVTFRVPALAGREDAVARAFVALWEPAIWDSERWDTDLWGSDPLGQTAPGTLPAEQLNGRVITLR